MVSTEYREAWRALPAKGILFRDDMAKAIVEGRKTVTRRVGASWAKVGVGDRLWGREAHCWADALCDGPDHVRDPPCTVGYRADLSAYRIGTEWTTGGAVKSDRPTIQLDTRNWGWASVRWRPSIYMPRWACRLDLRVTSITVQHPPIALLVDDDEAQREGFKTAVDFLAAWVGLHPDYNGPVYRIEFAVEPLGR